MTGSDGGCCKIGLDVFRHVTRLRGRLCVVWGAEGVCVCVCVCVGGGVVCVCVCSVV